MQPSDSQEQHVQLTISKCGDYSATFDQKFEHLVRRYRWSLHRCGKGKLYVRAERCPVTREKLRLYMHRMICEAAHGPCPHPDWIADHRNSNGLDNRAENLRWRSKQANVWALAVADARRHA